MAKNTYPKIGLALGSGGAKGLAHIGALKTLKKYDIPIDYIAGSSIGSFLGAFYAAHEDITKAEDLILNFNRRKGFELFDFTVKGGLFKGKKTERFIAEVLEGAKFETLKIPLCVVTTDIHTAESIIIKDGNLVKAIRASVSVPTFFQPIFYKDRWLADGGMSNPVPVDVITAMGADMTIAVNLDRVYHKNKISKMPPLTAVPVHSINILRHNLALQSVKTADVIISPEDRLHVGILGWNFLFDNKKAAQIIKAGEDATEEAIPAIKKAIAAYQYEHSRLGKFITFVKKLRKKGRHISITT
jgi:NTE family protein